MIYLWCEQSVMGWTWTRLTLRKGMMLSLAMACSRRGAPVSDWRPAPHVEKNEPITITQGEGHESVPTTRFPFTESPNLKHSQSLRNSTSAFPEEKKSHGRKTLTCLWERRPPHRIQTAAHSSDLSLAFRIQTPY